jgi:hypothetical protein
MFCWLLSNDDKFFCEVQCICQQSDELSCKAKALRLWSWHLPGGGGWAPRPLITCSSSISTHFLVFTGCLPELFWRVGRALLRRLGTAFADVLRLCCHHFMILPLLLSWAPHYL